MKRIQNLLLSRFDKDKLAFVSRITILFLFLVITINLLGITYSKYETEKPATGEAKVAFFVVKPGEKIQSVSLEKLKPSSQPVEYYIDVFNYDYDTEGRQIVTNVSLTYSIAFEMTTNLPLQVEIYKDNSTTNLATSPIIYQDKDCVYYKRYIVPVKYSFRYGAPDSDRYTIKITFPEAYKNSPNEYSGAIELLTAIIDAEQTTNRTILNTSDYETPENYASICNMPSPTE